MKRILLIVAFFVLAIISANAQRKVYCQIVQGRTYRLLSTKCTVRIDFGQETANLFSDDRLIDENGELIEFNSMIDALNYMSKLGWEFVQAYVTRDSSDSSSITCWLLSKTVDEDNDIIDFKTTDMMDQEQQKSE